MGMAMTMNRISTISKVQIEIEGTRNEMCVLEKAEYWRLETGFWILDNSTEMPIIDWSIFMLRVSVYVLFFFLVLSFIPILPVSFPVPIFPSPLYYARYLLEHVPFCLVVL